MSKVHFTIFLLILCGSFTFRTEAAYGSCNTACWEFSDGGRCVWEEDKPESKCQLYWIGGERMCRGFADGCGN